MSPASPTRATTRCRAASNTGACPATRPDTPPAGLAGAPVGQPAFAPLPTFWSDQHGQRVQAVGAPVLGAEDIRVLEGDPHGEIVMGYHHAGELVGVVGVGCSRTVARYRAFLMRAQACV